MSWTRSVLLTSISNCQMRIPRWRRWGARFEYAPTTSASSWRPLDYGDAFRLLTAGSQPAISEAVIGYVSRPLPPVRAISRHELDTIVGKVALHYFDLRDRAREAGTEGIVIDMPPDLPIDRIGALDGVHTYPIDTPFEFRSLPPTALRPENDVHRFLTAAGVRVRASITPPWFGRPGGGIRFTLQQPETGLRDLVVSGRLERNPGH
jgi:hypothetical protein